MSKTQIAAAVLGCAAVMPCMAEEVPLVPAAEAEMVLPATAQLSFPNDQACLTFTVEEESENLAEIQSKVNATMAEGQKAIQNFSSLAKIENNGYSASPIWTNPKKGEAAKIQGWTVSQSIKVTTPDVQGVASLVQIAQEANLALQGVRFSMTKQAKAEADDKLLNSALQQLDHRVNTIVQAMNLPKTAVKFKKLDFQNNPIDQVSTTRSMFLKASASNSVSRPVFEAGSTTLSLTVSGVFTIQQDK